MGASAEGQGAGLPGGRLAPHDFRHQARPTKQRRQRQRECPTQAVAIEAAGPRREDLQFARQAERDQGGGAAAAASAAAALAAASASAASCSAAAFSAARLAARQVSKGSGAGAPTNAEGNPRSAG